MVFEIQVNLYGMDTANSLPDFCAVKYPFVIGHDQPGVRSLLVFTKTERIE